MVVQLRIGFTQLTRSRLLFGEPAPVVLALTHFAVYILLFDTHFMIRQLTCHHGVLRFILGYRHRSVSNVVLFVNGIGLSNSI
jgi:hypothetical protein